MKTLFNLILILGLATSAVWAQDDAVPPPMPAAPILSAQQLDQLLGPIALYPDPLIAVILPAATQPTQIVMADRYVQNGGDPNAIEQQPWDPNVQGLAHYPAVLSWMDDNLNWTTQVGQAFQNQQQDVMDSIQRLRLMAYNLGNLQSTPQQQVVNDNGYIEIIPVSPSNVYVPEYQPDQVYYQAPSGPPYIIFSVGYVIGPWLCCDFDWHGRRIVYWTHNHPRPGNWWHYTPQQRNYYVSKHTTVWNPGNHVTPGFQGDRGWNNNQNFGNPYPGNQNNRTWAAPIVNRPAPAPTLGGHPQPTLSGHPQPVFGGYNNNAPNQYQTGNGFNQGNRNGNVQDVNHPTPAPNQWNQQNNHNSANNAFIGIQSAQDTRDYSQRGEQSTQSGGHSAPPAEGGNNGGASHGSGGGGNSGGGNAGGGARSSGGGNSGGGGGGGNNRH